MVTAGPNYIGKAWVGLGIGPIEQSCLADNLQNVGPGSLGHFLDELTAVFALGQRQLDLDQLVIVQGSFQLSHYTFGKPVFGHCDHRGEAVSRAAKFLLLCLCQAHGIVDCSVCKRVEMSEATHGTAKAVCCKAFMLALGQFHGDAWRRFSLRGDRAASIQVPGDLHGAFFHE